MYLFIFLLPLFVFDFKDVVIETRSLVDDWLTANLATKVAAVLQKRKRKLNI